MKSRSSRPPPVGWILANLLAAGAYLLAGLLGMLLQLGQLGASLVWPAAGIALALVYLYGLRLAPGLLLGMFAVSLYQLGLDDEPLLRTAVSGLLAVGGLLQAALGSALVRWRLGPDASLIRGREIFAFMGLAALLSGLVSPSLGTALLLGVGALPSDVAPVTWVTWWVGDAAGIAIFAPIVLAALSANEDGWRHRRRTVALPIVVLLLLVSLLHWFANRQEAQRLELLFERQASELEEQIAQGLSVAEDLVLVLKALFDSVERVDAGTFGEFAGPLLERHPAVQALEWIPRVSHARRVAQEGDVLPPIREPDETLAMVAAAERAEYFPIVYVEPLQGNERALGFDISTNPAVRAALERGLEHGGTVSSGPIHLIQDSPSNWGFVLYAPVYQAADPQALHGFVAAVFKVRPLLDAIIPAEQRGAVSVTITDEDLELFRAPASARWDGDFRRTATYPLADRPWQIEFAPTGRFFRIHFSWDTWWMHALGFAFTGAMAGMILFITGRSRVTERIVDQRTAELKNEADRRAVVIRHLDAHNEILRRLSDPEVALRDVLTQIIESAEWVNPETRCTISLLDDDHRLLRLAASRSLPHGLARALATVPVGLGHGSCAQAAAERRRVRVHDVASDDRWAELRGAAAEAGLIACWSEPILSGSGELLGTFGVHFFNKPRRVAALRGVHEDFAKLAALAIERRQSQSRIRRLAFFDSLTGLPNRERVLDRIGEEIELCAANGCLSAVLFIDVDDLKDVNDSLGHHQGDELIRELARRLIQVCREGDMAARLGGDEFVIVVGSRVASGEELEQLVGDVFERIRDRLAEPMALRGYDHLVSVSVGATLIPQSGLAADEILQQADTAMYRAKREGKNSLCFYHADMKAAAQEHFDVEKGLELALAGDALELHYQLQYDAERRPVAAEALLRWRHPQRGLLPAGAFIEIAERSALIVRLDAWVIEEACRRVAEFGGLEYLAVNVSARHLQRQDFVTYVLSAVERHRIRPDQLALEITEHSLIENLHVNLDKLHALKRAGLRISIDDFGTGYSSLFYLKHLPLNQIKIDKAFISGILDNPNDALIVSSVIQLARQMDLDLVAEGVETADQMTFLVDKGCNRFQGHLLASPVNAAELARQLTDRLAPESAD